MVTITANRSRYTQTLEGTSSDDILYPSFFRAAAARAARLRQGTTLLGVSYTAS